MFGAVFDRVMIKPFVPVGPIIVICLSTRIAEGPNVVSPIVVRLIIAGPAEKSPLLKVITPAELYP